MANYRAVHGVMDAIRAFLDERLPAELRSAPASVRLIGSRGFNEFRDTSGLGLYLHRISIDTSVPGGFQHRAAADRRRPLPDVPLCLHFLVISFAVSAEIEVGLMGWAMQQFATVPVLGVERLDRATLDWRAPERVQITTEDMPTEDLLRIWDGLPGDYNLTVPFLVRPVRVGMDRDAETFEPVRTRVFALHDDPARD